MTPEPLFQTLAANNYLKTMTYTINPPKWDEKRKRWISTQQKDGVRKYFYSSTVGRMGAAECRRKAERWVQGCDDKTKARIVLDAWITDYKTRVSKSSYNQYEQYKRRWLEPVFGHIPIGKIGLQHGQKTIDAAYKHGLAKKTLQNILGALSSFASFCRVEEYADINFEGIKIPVIAPESTRDVLPPESVRTIFTEDETCYRGKACADWYIHSYRLAIATGLRPGELLALSKSDVTDDGIRVTRSINSLNEYTKGKTKNAKRSQYAMNDFVKRIIQDQEHQLEKHNIQSDLLFPTQTGEQTTQQRWRRAWHTYRNHHNLPHNLPYEMRHTFYNMNKSVPEPLMKSIFGHGKNMDSTGTYGHGISEGEREILKKVTGENLRRVIDGGSVSLDDTSEEKLRELLTEVLAQILKNDTTLFTTLSSKTGRD